ncbi:hypothetical protein BB561_001776 [Smittium simulii]|uniref:Uncharacterized protein n=1 Tax=Smittium simulii TaxID=133385 RepID=A0A2T9YT74_9FUNG|nr:hypothetical protein BB561_001776 [Smittium simulii]
MSPEICLFSAEGSLDKVIELLDQDQALINTVDEDGRAANQPQVVEFLIKRKADINCKDEFNMTPLLICAASGYTDLVKILLASGADPNSQNSSGQTALHYSASKNLPELSQLLLAHKADPFLINSISQTALHRAAARGSIGVISLLLEHPSSSKLINLKDTEGNTPLHLACEENNADAAIALIKCCSELSKASKNCSNLYLDGTNSAGLTAIGLCSDPKVKQYIISNTSF